MSTGLKLLLLANAIGWLTFSACKDCAEPENEQFTFASGAVYIGCHPGPYSFHRDSLKEHCGNPTAFDFGLSVDSILTDCTYDESVEFLGADSPEIIITRSNDGDGFSWSVHIPLAEEESIPLTLDGTTYYQGQYPFLGAREIRSPGSILKMYIVNRYIGGCFHDIVIWELREQG